MLKENFKSPPKDYTLAPLWFWNDDLKNENLKWQMEEMLRKGVKEFIIHGRKGLEVEYLSPTWFDKVGYVLELAEKMDMGVWIYDEDNWPSGYAGGRVLEDNPDYCGKHIKLYEKEIKETIEIDVFKEISDKIVSIHKRSNGSYEEITNRLEDGKLKINKDEGDKLFIFYQDYTLWYPAYFHGYYVDMLNKEATKSFLKYTHEEYKKRFEKHFGNTVKGFFVDEPGFYNNLRLLKDSKDDNTIPWTEDFRDYFKMENGYDITRYLPLVWFEDNGKSLTVRKDLYETLGKMYRENFLEVQKEFCESNGIKLIGHLHYEEFLHYHIITQGDFMTAQKSLTYAGLDRIDLNPEKISEKLTSSASHIYGKERVLSETFALSGWGLTLQDMKKWADWQFVRGVNLLVPHAFYSSIEGDRKFECPPSQFYQNHYWKYYDKFSDYISRLSYILSQGTHIANIGVYYPISTAYEKYTPNDWEKVKSLDKGLQELANTLLENQLDFDFLNRDAIIGSKVDKESLIINDESFKMLILYGCTNISLDELEKVYEFAARGGSLLFIDSLPLKSSNYLDQSNHDKIMNQIRKLNNVYLVEGRKINKAYTYTLNPKAIIDIANKHNVIDVSLYNRDKDLKYLHRRIEGKDVYFVINESKDYKENKLEIRGKGKVEFWDIENGTSSAVEVEEKGESIIIPLSLHPYDSKLFVLEEDNENYIDSIDKDIFYNGEYFINGKVRNITEIPSNFILNGHWEMEIKEHKKTVKLTSWTELGYPHYSGDSLYAKDFILPKSYQSYNLLLDLGDVRDCAEVYLNDVKVGERVWYPYHFNITELVKEGKNTLKIKVTNTLSNTIEKIEKPSGLLGVVKIIPYIKYDIL